MIKKASILLFLLINSLQLTAQSVDQVIGRVVDVDNGLGIAGVQVQLLNTNEIVYTDSEGKFKINGEFIKGEPFYSFNVSKKGYVTIGDLDNKVVYGSGSIGNILLKRDLDSFLWLTIKDAISKEFLEEVVISIRGKVDTTNTFGQVSFDFTEFGDRELTASLSKTCYLDKEINVRSKGSFSDIEMVPDPDCQPPKELKLNYSEALEALASAPRDWSVRGQIEAIELLIANNKTLENSNMEGVSFAKADLSGGYFVSSVLRNANFSGTSLRNADLKGANLRFAVLEQANCTNAQAQQAIIEFSTSNGVNFENATLTQASFFLSSLKEASFRNADLRGASLSYCDLSGADFTGADLTDAIFYGSILDGATFDNAIVKNTDVTGAFSKQAVFSKDQLPELRQTKTPFRKLVVHLFDFDSRLGEEGSFQYPPFNSEYYNIFRWPLPAGKGLDFRTAGLQPVGTLNRYGGDPDIISYYRVSSKLWSNPSWGTRVVNFLKSHTTLLRKSYSEQTLIQGAENRVSKSYAYITDRIGKVSYTDPLILNNDSETVLSLAFNLAKEEDIDWKSKAKTKCKWEFQYNSKQPIASWEPIFPENIPCSYLEEEQIDLYKSWTKKRAEKLKVKNVQSLHYVSLANVSTSLKLDKEPELRDREVFNAAVQRQNKTEKNLIRLRNGINIRFPAPRSSYFIDFKEEYLPERKPLQYSSQLYFYLAITYQFESAENTQQGILINAKPIRAKIFKDEELLWEGKIYQL